MTAARALRRRVWLGVLLVFCASTAAAEPRGPHVAGSFYPAAPQELREAVTSFLNQYPQPDQAAQKPRILISPHAGYPYSGPVAAAAFRQIQGRSYDGVVVIAFTHRDGFPGASVDDRDAYRTPLGDIPTDQRAIQFLLAQPGIGHNEAAHESDEHSLEVMLPFLQVALGDVRLVPILMGSVERSDAQALANALAELAKSGDYLFVFSTDLSHYHPYDDAVKRDELTVNAVLLETGQAVDRLFQAGYIEACGRGPILTALLLAEKLGYPRRELLRYANSGDTTGDKSRVVGYAAVAMYERPTVADSERIASDAGAALVAAARRTLTAHFIDGTISPVATLTPLETFPELQRARGMFVTLRKHGELRGCIGRIETDVPLAQLLPTVALDAALHDTRFHPVTADELRDITIEVSVLTHPEPLPSIQDLVPGRDGVVLDKDGRSGVFLPQVWTETGWTRVEFLRELAHQKAGLDPDAWQQARLLTFQDQAFEEPSPSPATPRS